MIVIKRGRTISPAVRRAGSQSRPVSRRVLTRWGRCILFYYDFGHAAGTTIEPTAYGRRPWLRVILQRRNDERRTHRSTEHNIPRASSGVRLPATHGSSLTASASLHFNAVQGCFARAFIFGSALQWFSLLVLPKDVKHGPASQIPCGLLRVQAPAKPKHNLLKRGCRFAPNEVSAAVRIAAPKNKITLEKLLTTLIISYSVDVLRLPIWRLSGDDVNRWRIARGLPTAQGN